VTDEQQDKQHDDELKASGFGANISAPKEIVLAVIQVLAPYAKWPMISMAICMIILALFLGWSWVAK
jgi:hypothetical protein